MAVVKDLDKDLVVHSMIIMTTMRITMKLIITMIPDREEEERGHDQDQDPYMMMNTTMNTKLEEDVDLEEGHIEAMMIVDR